MLDNEPEGGERAGVAPAAETNDSTPTRPARTRRRNAPAKESEIPAATADDPTRDSSGQTAQEKTESAEAEALPAKTPRTRRKKTDPVAPQEPQSSPVDSISGPTLPPSPVANEGHLVMGTEPGDEDVTPSRRRQAAALAPPTVLFMAPEPETAPVRRRPVPEPVAEPAVEEEPAETTETRRRRRGRRTAEATDEVEELTAAAEETIETPEEAAEEDEEDGEHGAADRRRRRRGRRGRGRGKGTLDEIEEEAEEETAAQAEAEEAEETDDTSGLTRRRRRRRRRDAGEVDVEVEDDGVHTVVKIREPRRAVDEVQGVSGSTRLEAKRQRRRDGREQRRTRPPILSEAEFLARREAVDRVMVVRQRGDRTQIAVLEDGVLVEHYVSRATAGTMAGNVYLGRVQNVLPSMEAAFVDVGRGRNAVLYAGEVNWAGTGLEGRARSIEQALKSGDSVLVQVTKDPIGHKGARLTSHIALSGRHLVYVPHGNASGISRKLPDNERRRLRDILKKLVPDGAGVIVRTAAEGATEDELARDIKRLQSQWEDIQAKSAQGGAPVLLYEEPDLLIRVVRDLFNEDFRELVVQGQEAYSLVDSYLTHVSPDLVARLQRHTGVTDIFDEKRIDEQILKALDRKVYLPSGGHLVIERTEAMTVVDVNTGKYTGAGGNLEETVTRNNLEAAEEIVRQLRLRDIGGIIVIDFIDMVLESNRELVLRRLTECLGRDRTKHQVAEITSLGLVQMTRKRIGAGLLEAFSETCDCCKGRGVIIHTEPLPEKPRPGAGEKVKAVASASAATGDSRRGGGRSRASAPVAVEAEATEQSDTMGYDLSRYEEAPAISANSASDAGSAPLASPDEPDAAPEAGVGADEQGEGGGRRRVARSTRRRTQP
ncbi:MAG TPA: Rne/Rng family ribonuclease [Micromonospora sp.]|nr:Rne/Rng family ribonuclease [Micromonospora sp.]